MLHSEIVVVGCGNPLFGDDGFGPAVIEEMEKLTLPDNVTIQDGGAGAPHFIFNFLNPEVTKKLMIVDIADYSAKPGSISRISGWRISPQEPTLPAFMGSPTTAAYQGSNRYYSDPVPTVKG